jgi:hypothetical protein
MQFEGGKSMMLITGSWSQAKTFKMIPVSKECPYNEAIFDMDAKLLAVIGKEKKESFHMLPKLSDVGEPLPIKVGKKANGKPFAEERKALESYYEYYIETPEDIKTFINLFAFNADTFDYNQYVDSEKAPVETETLVAV